MKVIESYIKEKIEGQITDRGILELVNSDTTVSKNWGNVQQQGENYTIEVRADIQASTGLFGQGLRYTIDKEGRIVTIEAIKC